MRCFFLFLLFLASCGPSSIEDFKEEGQSKAHRVLGLLKTINTREQLMDAEVYLEAYYDEIAEILLAAEHFRKKYKLDSPEFSEKDHLLSENLRVEMMRIYRLDGGKEILEKCQQKAIAKLSETFPF